jgi:hypothetical protein
VAILFRAAGTRTKADVSVSGSPQSFSMPVGHVNNDWLLWVIVTDDNTGPAATPSGWSVLANYKAGTSTSSPYAGRPHVWMFHRMDNGALGSSQSCTFNTGSWPGGDPYVLGFIAAWSGADPSGPVEQVQGNTTTSTAAGLAHPQLTTAASNDWLISVRGVVSDVGSLNYTNSVGTDAERVDDFMSQPSSPSVSLYDSNADLTAGLQTQRTTTASGTCTYGGVAVSIALKPVGASNAVFASAGVALGTGSAFDTAAAQTTNGPWDLCAPTGLPTYSFAIDWNGDGNFTASSAMLMLALMGTGGVDEATQDLVSEATWSYGRDQERQLSPGAVGSAAMTLCNVSRKYNPENTSSPLFGNLDPARDTRFQVTWGGTVFPLFRGRLDDFDVQADFENRNVSFTFLDGMALLQGVKLSTPVYASLRTGDLVNIILDEIGWTAGRDIDLGATIVKWWWVEGQDALTSLNDLVKSEGPPAVAYIAPDGTFVFRDRHHRLQNTASITSNATFAAKKLGDCTSVQAAGFDIAKPFTYQHGWRDIVNSVEFEIQDRIPDATFTDVWTSEDSYVLSAGESRTVTVSASDPFKDAITPVANVDYVVAGAGVLLLSLSRTSGATADIIMTATGGGVVVTGMKLRAHSIPVANTVKVSKTDSQSISQHGERVYPDAAPWAGAGDAAAIASTILLYYAQRRPTVQLRVVTKDPVHFLQIVNRTISDRIHIVNGEMSIDDDFYVERITHTVQRVNKPGSPPVHSVVFGCEKAIVQSANPFRFDVRGAGFDQGIFDPVLADNPFTVFTFDHPTQGQFDLGQFGT